MCMGVLVSCCHEVDVEWISTGRRLFLEIEVVPKEPQLAISHMVDKWQPLYSSTNHVDTTVESVLIYSKDFLEIGMQFQ